MDTAIRVRTKLDGDLVQVRVLISHPMETGLRKDASGNAIPRKIINKFSATFNGAPLFSAELEPAVAANPYLQFTAKVDQGGTFRFTWVDDDGTITTAEETIAVT